MSQKCHYVLLQRNGHVLLSHISSETKPVVVHDMDVLLISLCLSCNDISTACKSFASHPWVTSIAPNIQVNSVIKRIEQLKLDGLFHILPTDSDDVLSVLNTLPSTVLTSVSVLRTNMNLAIEFGGSGFEVWSAKLQQRLLLPLKWVLVLMAYADGKTVKDVEVEKAASFESVEEVAFIAERLKFAGLLVEATSSEIKQQYFPPYFLAKDDDLAKRPTWQEITPDGRIPVYFVPHMENHLPLALGVLYSALSNYNNGSLLTQFQLIPIQFFHPNDLLNGPYNKFGAGVWLFSNYMWSVELNLQISAAIKKHNSTNITIHGGPSTPDYQLACEAFMKANPSVDIAVHGEGEVAICEVFCTISKYPQQQNYDEFALSSVKGISFKNKLSQSVVHTASRERIKDIDVIPSPYLSGYFDKYGGRVEAAIIETNRGCPYGCTFCDWGSATNQKVRKFDLARVNQEIEWIGKNQIKVMWIADANFGMYERDIDIAKYIVEVKAKYGYPQEVVVNYTKNSTLKLVDIIRIFTEGNIISQGIISIQTTDEKTLDVINRKNIRTERYDELCKIFSDLKLPLSTDLMIGLPGITVEAFCNDLQRYIDLDVSVKAYPTQLLPNSPMADPEYIEKYQIKVDENDYLTSTFSYSEQELHLMKAIYQVYVMAEGYSLLRYPLRFLQWQHGINAMDFLQKLLHSVNESPERYPQLTWAVRFFNHDKSMPGGWDLFYRQVAQFVVDNYNITIDSAFTTVLTVNKMSMPDDSLVYPLTVRLPHDFAAYFNADGEVRGSLEKYPPANFQVSDPDSIINSRMSHDQYDTHQFFWELYSDVARPKSHYSVV
ncbi:MAG: radical SAM protein [Gammaproteobacteria bacterium]|nr:radical SAM protein [Gammaproteobacteria bacterium]